MRNALILRLGEQHVRFGIRIPINSVGGQDELKVSPIGLDVELGNDPNDLICEDRLTVMPPRLSGDKIL
jgi:hypothetical protein